MGAVPAGKAMSVGELTKVIESAVKAGVPQSVLVRGEVSNFNFNRASGHAYFTLKDSSACLHCVMFRGEYAQLKFQPVDGAELLVTGNVRIYGPQGRHQLYVNRLEPLGKGALELALQQLRAKLAAEGLFDAGRKRAIPQYPSGIALVTSRETAALADMLKVLRRMPCLKLMLYHVPVQGDNCGKQMAAAIENLNQNKKSLGVDLILLGRGGGSLEDLWGFNDESLARAIAVSGIPIITGIGHEIDVSIADLVADHHAHTPTEAATFAISRWINAPDELNTHLLRLRRQMQNCFQDAQRQLDAIERHEVFRRPTHHIDRLKMEIDEMDRSLLVAFTLAVRRRQQRVQSLADSLQRHDPIRQLGRTRARIEQLQQGLQLATMAGLRQEGNRVNQYAAALGELHPRHLLRLQSARLEAVSRQLDAVNPMHVLKRGYTLTLLKKTNTIIRDSKDIKPNQTIISRFHDGDVQSTVDDQIQPKLFD